MTYQVRGADVAQFCDPGSIGSRPGNFTVDDEAWFLAFGQEKITRRTTKVDSVHNDGISYGTLGEFEALAIG